MLTSIEIRRQQRLPHFGDKQRRKMARFNPSGVEFPAGWRIWTQTARQAQPTGNMSTRPAKRRNDALLRKRAKHDARYVAADRKPKPRGTNENT